MIIGIIILLGFLISLVGFIFFIRYYLKARKDSNNNKQMLLTIETAEDEDAQYDKFYNSLNRFLRHVNWMKVISFFFFTGIAIIAFWSFASSNIETESSTGNQGVQEKQINPPTPINDTINNSEESIIDLILSSDGFPLWIFIAIGAVMSWFMFKSIFRRSSYDFL